MAVWAAVLPFLMNTAGWFLTESGRQPWIVQGIMLTKNGISPTVSVTTLWISLIAFVAAVRHAGHRRPAPDAAVLPEGAPAPPGRGRRRRAGTGRPVLGVTMSSLVPFWYIVIAILWTGFFILEGFDFGVGMLHSLVGRDEAGRRAAINTIGPLWDGNEVWLIVAGAGMFAAFPGWYATMFSGLEPRPGPAAGRPDRPRRGVRIPRQTRRRPLAPHLGRRCSPPAACWPRC